MPSTLTNELSLLAGDILRSVELLDWVAHRAPPGPKAAASVLSIIGPMKPCCIFDNQRQTALGIEATRPLSQHVQVKAKSLVTRTALCPRPRGTGL